MQKPLKNAREPSKPSETTSHAFPYAWRLSEGYPKPWAPKNGVEYHGKKVYTTFSCGGWSTMGYKLAGYHVIGANDIDPRMRDVYTRNHHPERYDLCPIGELLTKDLPPEMYDLDILDGSPPCSTFSLAGKREKGWKVKKKFREGQAEQILSDLFFDWIKLVDRLKPKVAIAENVKGMLIGNAKIYTRSVVRELERIGYSVQVFMLEGSTMGVPQKRQRVFFLCRRNDLELPEITMAFNEKPITFGKARSGGGVNTSGQYYELVKRYATLTDKNISDIKVRIGQKYAGFNNIIAQDRHCLGTIASSGLYFRYADRLAFSPLDFIHCGSFPEDYQFWVGAGPQYLVGMSVPPIMAAQVARQVFIQWLSKL